jgi:hypothetical protein
MALLELQLTVIMFVFQYLDKGQKMNKRIVYQNDEGGISIIVPAEECGLTIEEIAAKDVPAGKAYNIVDVSEIPTDRTFRDAWTWQ